MSSQPSQVAPIDEAQIAAIVQQMTLSEKIGQMTQVEKNSLTPEDVITYAIGSVLSGGGGNPEPNTPEAWASMVHTFQEAALKTRFSIPLLYGVDAVHGHSNVYGAVIFPHNIGLGAAKDPDLIRRIAAVTADELLATGVHYNFAPAVSIPQDIRWGRTYEGYSEVTEGVTPLSTAYVEGLQSHEPRVLGSVKHFIADGGTSWGTTRSYEWINGNWQAPGDSYKLDQGDAQIDEETLRAVHLPPYAAAIEAGAQNIMVSFSSWQGTKMHEQRYLINDVLKGELGFSGFVISDWMAVSQIEANYVNAVARSINAGLDMIMVPYDFRAFIDALTQAVQSGAVSMERIDDAVTRILRVKAWLGLFSQPFNQEHLLAEVGSAAHRAVAREAVQKTLVLLKNENNTLPLSKTEGLLIAGRGADNIGMQCGGWTITWQGDHGATTVGTSILDAFKQAGVPVQYNDKGEFDETVHARVGLIVLGEDPYAEGMGDRRDLRLSEDDQDVIDRLRARCERIIVLVLSGRPLLITDTVERADAVVAAFLPGTEGQGVADVLLGDVPFTGRLSYNWPRTADQIPLAALKQHAEPPLFERGFGLTT